MRNSGWSLREEIGSLIEQWYWLVLALLVGGSVGWGVAYVFPADFEAHAPLFVAFHTDGTFTSPDDYKNAQFEEVSDLILSDVLLDSVLAVLQQDQGWGDWTREDLRARLTLRWRNAGRWDLVARDRDRTRAERLVAVWRVTALEHLTGAISHAQTFYQLDQQLNAILHTQEEVDRDQAHLQAVEAAFRDWLAQPGEGTVSTKARAELWAYALSISMPDGFPAEGADKQAYANWAEGVLVVLDTQQTLLAGQAQAARERMDTLADAWLVEKKASQALTAFLVVEQHEERVETTLIREPGLLALVGGGIGVLGWFVFRLVLVARKREDD